MVLKVFKGDAASFLCTLGILIINFYTINYITFVNSE